MKLTKKEHYLLTVLGYIARYQKYRFISVKELREKYNVCYSTFEKIMNIAKDKKLVLSKKGPHGGYKLSRLPREIRLTEIVDFLKEPENLDVVKNITDKFIYVLNLNTKEFLENITLADLIK